MSPEVAVVVLNWNGWAETQACLRSLAGTAGPPARTIVVDNGSTDGSPERIATEFPDVELVRSHRNLGFAAGANLGIRRALEAGAEFVWLLNNDAQVEPRTLPELADAVERDPKAGIVGGVVFEAGSGRVHSWGGGRISGWTGIAKLLEAPARLDYVTGACMLVRREVFEQVGLFDETYFFYFEDADLCLRARAAGWRLAVAPEARVRHAVGATVNRGSAGGRSALADWFQVESSGIYLGRHGGARAPAVAALRLAGIAARRARRRELSRVPILTRALVRGYRRGRAATTPAPPPRPSA